MKKNSKKKTKHVCMDDIYSLLESITGKGIRDLTKIF